MVSINDNDYRNIARPLIAAIGCSEFYNGAVEYETEDFSSSLHVTMIIYREPLLDPADMSKSQSRIRDIIPIWWEYHLFKSGIEEVTDFSWSELKEFLL